MRRVGIAVVAAMFLLFGLGALEHAVALVAGREPMVHALLAVVSSRAFVHGPGSFFDSSRQLYLSHLLRIDSHILFAGVALTLGVFQFVPSLRQRHPDWHRRNGRLMLAAAFAGVMAAMAFLVAIAPAQAASGKAYYLGLWALSGLTLFLLVQAVLAVLSRDHRSHMVWMAAAYACLATAPVVRTIWLVWAPLQVPGLAAINLAAGACSLLISQLLMSAWLAWVGDDDLPAPRLATVQSAWPRPVLLLLVTGSVLAILVVVAQAAFGLDALAGWRTATRSSAPGWSALPWAAGSLLLLLRFPTHWIDLLAGRRLDTLGTAGALLMGWGALVMGLTQLHISTATWAMATFWSCAGSLMLLLLWLSQSAAVNSAGRNAWGLYLLFIGLLPALVPALLPLCARLAMDLDEAMVATLFIGLGGLGACGMATGFGARLRLQVRREDLRHPGSRQSALQRAA